MKRSVRFGLKPILVRMRAHSSVLQVPVPFHEQTRNGVFGDARLASREIGEAIVETAIERTLTFVESFLATYPDK